MLCGQVLADMGAEVIQIEPPGGASGRRLGPFLNDVVDPHGSLLWNGYARGKKSVELDLVQRRETFIDLVAKADILIESEAVGAMSQLGYGYADLQQINPALIYASITPFGIDGPKAHWAASDLTLVASAGPMALTGDHDRAPLRITIPQAWNHAACEAFTGILVALQEAGQFWPRPTRGGFRPTSAHPGNPRKYSCHCGGRIDHPAHRRWYANG